MFWNPCRHQVFGCLKCISLCFMLFFVSSPVAVLCPHQRGGASIKWLLFSTCICSSAFLHVDVCLDPEDAWLVFMEFQSQYAWSYQMWFGLKIKTKVLRRTGGRNKVTGKNKIVLLHPWSLSCKKAKESRPSEGFSLSEGLKRQTGATQMSQIFIPITSKTWEGAELGSWVGGAGTRRSTTKHQCSSCWTPKTEIRRRNLESCCWSQLDQEDSGSILFIL